MASTAQRGEPAGEPVNEGWSSHPSSYLARGRRTTQSIGFSLTKKAAVGDSFPTWQRPLAPKQLINPNYKSEKESISRSSKAIWTDPANRLAVEIR